MSEVSAKTTVGAPSIVLPAEVKERLDALRDGRPYWRVVERLLNEHAAITRDPKLSKTLAEALA